MHAEESTIMCFTTTSQDYEIIPPFRHFTTSGMITSFSLQPDKSLGQGGVSSIIMSGMGLRVENDFCLLLVELNS
jgi:hypothetical protein